MHTLKAQFPSLKPLTWSTLPFHQLWATFLLNVNQHNFLKLDQMTHVILMNQDSSSLVTMQFLANFKFVCFMLIIHWCRILFSELTILIRSSRTWFWICQQFLLSVIIAISFTSHLLREQLPYLLPQWPLCPSEIRLIC